MIHTFSRFTKIRISIWMIRLILVLITNVVQSQTNTFTALDYDTNYYHSYTDKLTTRLYSSVKYTNFSIQDQSLKKAVNYNVNNKVMLGLGANYSVFGLNIAFNLPFNEKDFDQYGETEYIDLQSHLYLRKYVVDFYLQRYKGFYINNPMEILQNWIVADSFPKRPDIRIVDAGLAVQYILNSKKFSYRAAYIQNEWQKKSAGSFILGASIFYVMVKGDSSLIPKNIEPPDFADGSKYDKSTQFSLGANAGYTHTFVAWKKFFLVIGLSAGPAIGNTSVHQTNMNQVTKSGITLNFNALGRGSFGYNSHKFYMGVFYLNQIIGNKLPQEEVWNFVNTGNFRFNLVYRFNLKRPIKLLNPDYWKFLHKEKSH